MLVLRFLFILGIITIAVTLGVYVLTRDPRYLRFTKQFSKLILIVVIVALVVGLVRAI
ncbi:MAG: hypothetical protein LBV44_10290 [Methylobacillus sp.]|jgi:cytochrome bd-type quinol oxidase subunit 1|nr:hypothetical protein [Methylobacillus sp.]